MLQLTSVIKNPEGSVGIGLAEAAAVYVIYQAALPNHADIRSADPHNPTIESARNAAAWKAAALLGLVFLLTHDLNSFLIGGAALGGIDYMTKHANAVHPATNKLSGPQTMAVVPNDVAFAMPEYTDNQPQPDMGY